MSASSRSRFLKGSRAGTGAGTGTGAGGTLFAVLALAACSSGGKGAAPGAASSAPTASAALPASAAASAPTSRCTPRSPRRLSRAAIAGSASSSIEIVRAGAHLLALVADHDERALHTVDVESMRQIAVTPLSGRPGHVLALSGGLLAVSLRDAGRVVLLEPTDDALAQPFEERCVESVAVEPWALAEAGDRLLVASGFGAALTVLRAVDLGAPRLIPLPREPRAVLVANGGGTAFVTHAVGGVVSAINLNALEQPPEAIKLHAGRRLAKNGELDDKHPREAAQGYALAAVFGPRKGGERDALRIFAPHTSVDPGAPASGVSAGYGGPGVRAIAPIVSVIDPLAKRSITNHVEGAFHSSLAQDCILPRGAVADEHGLFVACLDIDAVLELDPHIGDPTVAERRRFALPAGPSALSLTEGGKQLFVWSELARALSRVEREGAAILSVPLWRRAGEPRDTRAERGRRLFNTSRDARIALGRACASCHPEGRDDGLLWTSPDGARQTLMLAGRLEGTAPYGWFGENPTVREHVKKTFARLGGTGMDAPPATEDLDALLAYVTKLPPPPTAKPPDAKAMERGKAAFLAYGCDGCHKGGGTDGIAHDLGTGNPSERRAAFDTPSLRGVRGSAPYFHDGRYATLAEVLSAKDNRMITEVISDADKKALIAYLETL